MHTLRRTVIDLIVALGVILGILAVAILPFLSPAWIAFEQDRAEAAAWTGFDPPVLRVVTDEILADLVLGPPAFDVAVDGVPVLNERERSHMRDVRAVFIAFYAAALVSVALAVVVGRLGRAGSPVRRGWWVAVRRGAIVLVVGLIGLGVVSFVAFEALFELFHRLFFPGGTYTFDPTTERLVQLFPFRFWQETAIAVGAVAVVLGLALAWFAAGRSRRGGPA